MEIPQVSTFSSQPITLSLLLSNAMGKVTKVNKLLRASAAAPVETPLFQTDSKGDSSVRHSLLHQASSANPASGRLRKGASFTKVLKSDSILAMRSNTPALTSRVVPSALKVIKKDQRLVTKVDRATKERLRRMTGRSGEGEGLWGVSAGGPRDELLTEAMKSAGEYDPWEIKVVPSVAGEDLAMKAIIAANTEKYIPKVRPASSGQRSTSS